jgi:predicted lipoprotein
MHKRLWLLLPIVILSGCRIVSQQELADLKNPPNPKMANIAQTWQQKLVPQIQHDAKPVAELLNALKSSKDFDSACQTYGYRAQEENPCVFSVNVSGEVTAVNTTSRNGRMTVKDVSGDNVTVQVGPIFPGTVLRDAYKGASYQDFNDQVLFGDYSRAINQQAANMMSAFKPKVGDKVQLSGVFSSFDTPEQVPNVTPAAIVRQ